MDLGIKDKIALVTGASRGIGRGIAEALLKEGAKVIISSSNAEKLGRTYEEFAEHYGKQNIIAIKCDLNNELEIIELNSKIIEKFGSLDILVINYGGPKPGFYNEFDEVDWDNAYSQLFKSVVKLTNLVLPYMIEHRWGRILTVTSSAVKQPIDNLILSNSFRAAVTAYVRTVANQVAKYGVTMNNVAPGYIMTERIENLITNRMKVENKTYDEILKSITNDIPMGRIGRVEEIAEFSAFICSEKASYITGQTLLVDGGRIKTLL